MAQVFIDLCVRSQALYCAGDGSVVFGRGGARELDEVFPAPSGYAETDVARILVVKYFENFTEILEEGEIKRFFQPQEQPAKILYDQATLIRQRLTLSAFVTAIPKRDFRLHRLFDGRDTVKTAH